MTFLHEIADLVSELGLEDSDFTGGYFIYKWGPADYSLDIDRIHFSSRHWGHMFQYCNKHTTGWKPSADSPTTIEWIFHLESGIVTLVARRAVANVVSINSPSSTA